MACEEYLNGKRKEIAELRVILKGDCSLDAAESRLDRLEREVRKFESFYDPLIKDAKERAKELTDYREKEKRAG